jgi:hypothetical protein
MKAQQQLPECIEGAEAFHRFDATMGELLSVPRTTLNRRNKEYRRKMKANPSTRRPKLRISSSASPDPAS